MKLFGLLALITAHDVYAGTGSDDPKGESTKGIKLDGKKTINGEGNGKHRTHGSGELIIQEVEDEIKLIKKLEKEGEIKKKDEDAALREIFKHTPIDDIPDGVANDELRNGGHGNAKTGGEQGTGRKHDTPITREKRDVNAIETGKLDAHAHWMHLLSRTKRTIYHDPDDHWDGALAPYRFVVENTAVQILNYIVSMARWEFNTCLRFVQHTDTLQTELNLTHNNYINFLHNASGCWSYVGNIRRWNGQSISCCNKWACIHEIGHAVGFAHEQLNVRAEEYVWLRADNPKGSSYTSERYDVTSEMHYGWSSNIWSLDPKMTYLNGFTEDHFYMWRIFSETYGCQAIACPSMSAVQCENEGYISPLEGHCQCVCPLGFDPETNCADMYQGDNSRKALAWPGGSYALPKTGDSCIASTMTTGTMTQTASDDVDTSSGSEPFGILGSKNGPTITQTFCVQDSVADTGAKWPIGMYCIHRIGGACPTDFVDGAIEFTDVNGATVTGDTPDADITSDKTVVRYCCRNDGGDEDPVTFPTSSNFALYPTYDDVCQSVKDMYSQYQSYTYTNVDKASINMTGTTPYVKMDDAEMKIGVCYYRPIIYGCGEKYVLSETNRLVMFNSPNYPQDYNNNQHCHWFFEGPAGSNLKLTFEDIDIEASSSGCYDSVEVREFYRGQAGHRYCGSSMEKSIVTNYETLMVIMRNDYNTAERGFNATVELITADDYCYDISDKGATYRGGINVTRDYEACLPWHEMRDCRHSPFHEGDFFDGLSGNACRNPGHGIRPWCYIGSDCRRNYCDVCGKETCLDLDSDCADVITADPGYCNTKNGQKFCRKTCGHCPVQLSHTDLSCGAPDVPGDSTLTGTVKESYSLGETVEFTCDQMSTINIKSTCTTDGKWTAGGYVCHACPYDWTQYNGHCYRNLGFEGNFPEAQTACAGYGANVTTASTKAEEDFLITLKGNTNKVWLDFKDEETEGTWVWGDGSPVTYTDWEDGEPNNWSNQDCASLYFKYPEWEDKDCITDDRYILCKMPINTVREICADQIEGCEEIIIAAPESCSTSDEFSKELCPKSCGDCLSTATCDASVPSTDVILVSGTSVIPAGSHAEYKCPDGFVMTSGDTKRACLISGYLSGEVPVCADKSITEWPNSDHPIEHRQSGFWNWYAATNDADEAMIKRKGNVTAWHFYADEAGEITFHVYKVLSRDEANGQMQLELMGYTNLKDLKADREYYYELQPADQIPVEPGYLIGVDFENTDVVKYTRCDADTHPAGANAKSVYWGSKGKVVGSVKTAKKKNSCSTFSYVAIVDPTPL